MSRNPGELMTRGPDGLLPVQREYLQACGQTGSDEEARQRLDLSPQRVRRWLKSDDAFRAAYQEFVEANVAAARLQAHMLSEKAGEAIEELLAAMKPVTRTAPCTQCGAKVSITVEVRDSIARAKVAEMVWKAAGVLKDIRHIEGEVIVDHLSVGQRLALALWQQGKPISEQVRRDLVGRGLIEDTGPIIDAVLES